MCPILFHFGIFNVYGYGFMVALAFLACGFLLSRRVQELGQPDDFAWNFCFWAVLGGIAGGRIVYIFLNFAYFLRNPGEIFMVWHGGLVWYGGFAGGFIAALAYLKIKKVPFAGMLDLVAPYIALGQAIGRIGCFLNGCCYGKPAAWGFYFPAFEDYLIPAQIFSSLALLGIFLLLRYWQKKPHAAGAVFLCYVLLYSLKRFFMEFLRGDSPGVIFGLTVFQIISLGLFFSALSLWIIISSSAKKKGAGV